jgi:hypothetical protein
MGAQLLKECSTP